MVVVPGTNSKKDSMLEQESDSELGSEAALLAAYNKLLQNSLQLEETHSTKDVIEEGEGDKQHELHSTGLEFSLFSNSKPLYVTTAIQETVVVRVEKPEDYEIMESDKRTSQLKQSVLDAQCILAEAKIPQPSCFAAKKVITVNSAGIITAGLAASDCKPLSRSAKRNHMRKATNRKAQALNKETHAAEVLGRLKNPNSWGRIPKSEKSQVLGQLKCNQKRKPKYAPKSNKKYKQTN
ncbi:hypothetical protein BB561_004698 [Smittium simulii]|uniref:Uncharacterized protein n=1 Tax=Smittium simulii TaxID=133385 RepID=A0A2T9YER8_9FUNG|nr:hypothetical protein BB561_004698 [Smittium simulii]